ncbi:13652_t:CDS:2 [Funneliformis mosseae]|uniref:13652_t:CDS:1 n=1 Tax=Funneliformis mosseae TaxID=27381 RepID=A0A9N8ZBH1_FUNMO|nr:13652_t:CDS:2 [Funneliformis mosseae]
MMLDENDGSDMELDSDTSLDAYHIYSNVSTKNQCSKTQTSQNSDRDNDKSSDREQLKISQSSPSRRGEASYYGNDRIKHSGYLMNNPPKSYKSPSKSLTTVNVSNGQRPIERRERIKFELKSTGYKNKLQSTNSNMSIKNNSDASRNKKDYVRETQLSPLMNKSLLSSVTSYPSYNVTKKIDPPTSSALKHVKDDSVRKYDDKSATESNFKDRATRNLVTVGKGSDHSFEKIGNKSLSLVEKGSSTMMKGNAGLIVENSMSIEKGINQKVNDFTTSKLVVKNPLTAIRGNDQSQKQEADENSVILEKFPSQVESQTVNDDKPKAQESSSKVVQKEQTEKKRQITELPIANDKIIKNDVTSKNSGDDKNNKINEVIVLSDQDHHPKDDIIIEISGDSASSGNEIDESDKSETNNSLEKGKSKSKGKQMATPANQTSSPSKTEVASKVFENICHLDHLADLMTNLTDKISKNSQMVQPISQDTQHSSQETRPINQDTQLAKHLDQPNGQANQEESTQSTIQGSQPDEEITPSELSNEIIEKYRELDNTLSEFDKIAKKAVSAYGELNKLLPEGTMVKIDPPSTYKWDIIASMLGIADINKIKINQVGSDTEDHKKNSMEDEQKDVKNESNVVMEISSEAEFDEEELDVLSDDPDDKNFKCRSTILRYPNPKRWHNTRSNRPPSANLRQRTRVVSDSFNIPTASITHNSPSKKKLSHPTPKRSLRARKAENEEEDTPTPTPNSDKVYEDGRPRRPGNGFSYFCGDICAKVRNEKLNISGTIAYAAEIWKKMSAEEKQPWLDRGAKSKIEYQEQITKWKEQQTPNNTKKRKGSSKHGSSSKRPRND